jgi:predicted nuclease with TOPRIM domain
MKEEAPVSAKTKKGMTLTIDDRKFIKCQNDYIIDLMKEKLDDNVRYLAEILFEYKEKMFDFMEEIREGHDEIRDELKKINKRLDEHETRIERLEDCFKLKNAG